MLGIENRSCDFFLCGAYGDGTFLRLSDSAADTKTRAASSAGSRCGGYRLLAVGERVCVSSDVLYDLWKYPLVLCSGNRSRAADCCWGAAFVETNFQEIEKNIKNKEILIKTAE